MSSENGEASAQVEGQRSDLPPTGDYPPNSWGYPPTGGAPYPPYQPYAPYPYPYYYAPYGYGYGAYSWPAPQTSGMAIASLVCSIVGLVAIGALGGVVSAVGVIFGHLALREIKNSNGWRGGRGLALSGTIIGYIGIGLSLLFLALYVLYLIFIVALFQSYPTTSPEDLVPHLLGALQLLR